mmetsp:Transcript_22728/g.70613  ORF Transcript_22728/g.70613 Transcript_22728/m.70613 type:complete len:182 (+) Transcript_22728:611-1156(+)
MSCTITSVASSFAAGRKVVPTARPQAAPAARGAQVVRAGWLPKNNKDPEGREIMWEEQQRIIRERKSGKGGMSEKRAKARAAVSKQMADERKGIRKKLDPIKKPLYTKEQQEVKTGIIIPIAPFGLPEMDGGERFDLRLPYVDQGYEDPDADVMGKFMNLFKGKKKEEAPKKGKGRRFGKK